MVAEREFRQFILNHDLFIPLLFLARVIFVTALELIAPARKISYALRDSLRSHRLHTRWLHLGPLHLSF